MLVMNSTPGFRSSKIITDQWPMIILDYHVVPKSFSSGPKVPSDQNIALYKNLWQGSNFFLFRVGGDRDMCSSWHLIEKPDKWQQWGTGGPSVTMDTSTY